MRAVHSRKKVMSSQLTWTTLLSGILRARKAKSRSVARDCLRNLLVFSNNPLKSDEKKKERREFMFAVICYCQKRKKW